MLCIRSFRCMTTGIELFVDAGDWQAGESALREAEAFFAGVEARFSRFLPDSELSRLNQATGRTALASADLREIVRLALQAAQSTGGIFDPTVLDALEAAGYDRSIEHVRAGETAPVPDWAGIAVGRWAGVWVDDTGGTITLPVGLRLDLGGIAKGWAADQAAALLRPLGPGLVNAGGDLRAWGDEPGGTYGQGWLVAVDDPQQPGRDVVWLRVQDCAVATSSVVTRRWVGGHHLIDPRSGRPAVTDLLSVTVLAPTVAQAEIAAKVVLILGRDAGLAWLDEHSELQALLAGAGSDYFGTPGITGVWV